MISEHKGEEAGIKSSTLKVNGENLYGMMKKVRRTSFSKNISI